MKKVCTVLVLIVLTFLALVFLITFMSIRKVEKIDYTRSYERGIVSWLEQRVTAMGTFTNIHKAFISSTFFSSHTNTQGEILDTWNKPFQIESLGQTNFIVRSAGPNKNFSDADDIIFNSVSNDFVRP